MSPRNATAAKTHFDRAVAALRAGDGATAERLCRRALDQHPRDANLHNLLGAVLMQTGRAGEAIQAMQRATELAPGAAPMHEALGQALLFQGRFDEGLRSLETARRIEPGRISVLTKMGDAFTRLGRDEDALRIYRDLVSRRPSEVGALQRLGGAAFRLRLYAECEAAVSRVVELAPELYEGRMDLGVVQHQLDKLEPAERSFREAARLDPKLAEPHTALGRVLTAAGRLDEALAEFELALAIDPSSGGALHGLGSVLELKGDHARATETYRRCIARHPQDGTAWWALAEIPAFRFEDHELTAMRSQLAGAGLNPIERVHMAFALAKAVDDRGERDEAFRLFDTANQLRRRQLAYDPDANRRGYDELIRVFNADFLRVHANQGETHGAPIFVVGLPGSGVDEVATLLSRHPGVAGVHDRPVLNWIAAGLGPSGAERRAYPAAVEALTGERLRELGAVYLERTRATHGGARVFIDRVANNFGHLGLIAAILPDARVVNVRRHPLDAGLDTYRRLFLQAHPYSYDLRELGDFMLQYERLMDHWHEVLPGRVLDVRYDDIGRDPQAELRRLLVHCGLSPDADLSREWTPSLPPGRWREYEAQLAPLIAVLEPALRRWPEDTWPASMRSGGAA